MTSITCRLSSAALLIVLAGEPFPTASAEHLRERVVLEEHAIPHGALPEEHETHAATITEAPDGTLIAAWFGGTGENAPDVKIWASRKEPDAQWNEPFVVDTGNRDDDGREGEYSCWNPVLFTHPNGTVYLYYKISGINEIPKGYRNWWGAVKTSADAGKTWSKRIWLPRVEPVGKYEFLKPYAGYACGPVKNRPIIMPDGSLLCGASSETDRFGWRVHFELYRPDDWNGAKHGVKIIGPLLEGKKGIQPSFLVHSSDFQELQVLTREDGTAWSHDGGAGWTQVEDGPINTSKGLHAVTVDGGWHFLAFNPEGRTPLSLARTRDGRNWEVVVERLSWDEDLKMDYPTMFQAKNGNLHVVHSYGRDHIRHLVLDTGYLTTNP